MMPDKADLCIITGLGILAAIIMTIMGVAAAIQGVWWAALAMAAMVVAVMAVVIYVWRG